MCASIDRKKNEEEERMLISRDLSDSFLPFFLIYTYRRSMLDCLRQRKKKSYYRPRALTCVADDRCQRSRERERDKYQKNDRKTTTTTTTQPIHRG